MATCGIHSVKVTPGRALSYITKPEKTEEGTLVFSNQCSADPDIANLQMQLHRQRFGKDKEILLHHGYISFEGQELTPEDALEFAKEVMEKKFSNYQYVVTVHTDTDNVHCHFLINAVGLDGKKYLGNETSLSEVRACIDQCCEERGLNVVIPKEKGVSYKEWMEQRNKTSWKELVKNDIDEVIQKSESFDGFLKQMRADGYYIKQGSNVKHMLFKKQGMEKGVRGKTLGTNYTEQAIRERILLKEFNFMPEARKLKRPNRKWSRKDRELLRLYYRHAELSTNIALAIYLIRAKITGERMQIKKFTPTRKKKIYSAVNQEIRKLEQELQFIREHQISTKEELYDLMKQIKAESETPEQKKELRICEGILSSLRGKGELPESIQKEISEEKKLSETKEIRRG